MRAATAGVVVSALLLALNANARIVELDLTLDSRRAFQIEDFGFQEGGKLNLKVDKFQIVGPAGMETRGVFLFHKVDNQATTLQDVQYLVTHETCVGDFPDINPPEALFEYGTNTSRPVSMTHNVSIGADEAGMYELIYALCLPAENAKTTLRLRAEFVNVDGNYLSAGEIPLPAIHIVFALLFGGMAAVWILHLRQHSEKIHTVHHLMTLLVVIRALTSLTEGIQLGAISAVGHTTGWSALFYIVLFAKGLLFFVAVLLIGTGWSLLKPFLSDNEKRIFMIVLPLQTIANTAIIVIDEVAVGSSAHTSWSTILYFAEGACCVAVMLPTAWSIRSLNSAAAADGKAKEALDRLVRFRNFFVGTMGFLYFTRLGSYAMEMMVGYAMLWSVKLFVEVLTLVYYFAVGRAFRPGADNPYMRVRADSGDEGEFGLGDDGVDTSAAGSDVGDDGEMLAQVEEGRGSVQAAKVLEEAQRTKAAAASAVIPTPPQDTPPAGEAAATAESGKPAGAAANQAASREASKAAKD